MENINKDFSQKKNMVDIYFYTGNVYVLKVIHLIEQIQ